MLLVFIILLEIFYYLGIPSLYQGVPQASVTVRV